MTIYVHIDKQCEEDALRLNPKVLDSVRMFERNISRKQESSGFDSLQNGFRKKAFGQKYRLLAREVNFGDDLLLVFLRVMAKGTRELEDFEAKHDRCLSEEDTARKYYRYSEAQALAIFTDKSRVEAQPRPPALNADEQAWLGALGLPEASDDLVFESRDWCMALATPGHSEYWQTYQEILRSDAFETFRTRNDGDFERVAAVFEARGRAIVAVRDPDEGISAGVLLIKALAPAPRSETERQSLISEAAELLVGEGSRQERITRLALRAYPALALADDKIWRAIQSKDSGNLSLSPEESELLRDLRSTSTKTLSLPLFINGRAGSGKSTILGFIAKQLIAFELRGECADDSRILYVTYSDELVEKARASVASLLLSNAEELIQSSHEYDEARIARVEALVAKTVVSFRDFATNAIALNEENEEPPPFPLDTRVGFAKFRKLWESEFQNHNVKKGLSPEFAWHVIRSYIKGCRVASPTFDDDGYMTPERYLKLPIKRISVSGANYKMIYDLVWPWYRRLCETHELWDDQDLAYALVIQLDGAADEQLKLAVICDEAQDFTPLEFSAIFGISVFSRRTLQPREIERVPIVFAGDPFQTINPTGFSWEAVQSLIFEEFQKTISPTQRQKTEISHRDLLFNYRSSPSVVRFCNTIQLLRSIVLDDRSIRPQTPWQLAVDEVPVVWIDADSPELKTTLQNRTDLIKIIDCQENEEVEFVQNDELLRPLLEFDPNAPPNVLSAMRSKGLEYDDVVLYRFGRLAPAVFRQSSNPWTAAEDIRGSDSEWLELVYFLNRLYVAASRAQKRLIIVDSREAFDNLWRFVSSPQVHSSLKKTSASPELWEERDLTALTTDTPDCLSRTEPVDYASRARDYDRRGRATRDSYLMRQAASAFKSMGDQAAAAECRALAEEYESRFESAGDIYDEDVGRPEKALDCYWQARAYNKIESLAGRRPELASRPECRLAATLVRHQSRVSHVLLSQLSELVNSKPLNWPSRTHPEWQDGLEIVMARLAASQADEDLDWEVAFALYKRLEATLAPKDTKAYAKKLGFLAFRASRPLDAVAIWTSSQHTMHTDFFRAKAATTEYPENLQWLLKSDNPEQALTAWSDAGLQTFEFKQEAIFNTLVEAALTLNRAETVFALLQNNPHAILRRDLIERMLRLLMDHGASDDLANVKSRTDAITRIAEGLAQNRMLLDALRWARGHGTKSRRNRTPKTTMWRSDDEHHHYVRSIMRELALWPTSSEWQVADRQEIESYLAELIGPSNAHLVPDYLPRESVGAVIERLNGYKNAVLYYEYVETASDSNRYEIEFAARRWVKVKAKWAAHDGATSKTSRHMRDIQERCDQQGLPRPEELPEFPAATDLRLAPIPRGKVNGAHEVELLTTTGQFPVGDVEVRLFKSGKLRLTHSQSGDAVTFQLRSGSVPMLETTEFEFVESDSQSWTFQAFELDLEFTAPTGLRVTSASVTKRFRFELPQQS